MQGLKTLYRKTLKHIPLSSNFDDLDMPYRAIATNLATGDAKVFADGGIVSNLPVKAALNMGLISLSL